MCAHCGTGTVDFPEVPPLILISPLTRLISGGGVQNLLRNYPASPNPTYGKLTHIPQPDIEERWWYIRTYIPYGGWLAWVVGAVPNPTYVSSSCFKPEAELTQYNG